MAESRQIENNLRALPASPGVMRVSTAATIAELEDRIATIDFQLNDTEIQLSPEDEEIFWRERVRLMKSLLQLRYAQAQRSAF
jgi:predicted sulfurtransferase